MGYTGCVDAAPFSNGTIKPLELGTCHPQGHLLIALLEAGAISNSELSTVVTASRRPWAMSGGAVGMAPSGNAALGTPGEGKENRSLAIMVDFVIGHIFH